MSGALHRRAVLALLAGAGAWRPAWGDAAAPFAYAGRLVQGGTLIGRTRPGARLGVDGREVGAASAAGLFVVGLDRDAPDTVAVAIDRGRGWESAVLPVARGLFDVQRIDGLPDDQVAPSDPALLARIKLEAARKAAGFASRDEGEGFAGGFAWPLAAPRISARFGGQRVLNGQPKRPHYGIDLAAPVGTLIAAPAPGRVAFAEARLHFEGGLTLIDHGQGLITAYLHQSAQAVRAGDRVARGQVIGAVGRTGRATGPHLCWRMKWRDRNLDPSLLVGVTAPGERAS